MRWAGNFDCVTLSQVDWHAGTVTVTLAIGASGRRLSAVEGLRMPWNDFAPLLNPARAGQSTYRANLLPLPLEFRGEHHLVLPLSSQFAEVQGLMTVSAAAKQHEALEEALPLLELLANQAATALDNNILYSTMEQRVIAATATIEQGRAELALAHGAAETLYRIVRTLAVSLDEREVLSQALELIAQATDARHGDMMLVEPTSGRLVFRTIYQAKRGVLMGSAAADELERAHALAGWVLNRQVAVLEDTRHDTRWPLHSIAGEHERSALAAPLMLEIWAY